MANLEAGVCAIKEEFIYKRPEKNDGKHKLESHESDSSENANKKAKAAGDPDPTNGVNDKRQPQERKRGQNKSRPKTFKDDRKTKPCPSIINVTSSTDIQQCQYNNCQYLHDPVEYIKSKPKDLGDECHVFMLRGRCPRGISCRFGSKHISPEGYNIVLEDVANKWVDDTKNTLVPSLQMDLQKKKYNFDLAEKLVKHMDPRQNSNNSDKELPNAETNNAKNIGVVTDEDLIKLLPREKKQINWRDKLYLAPLTTVGNLPFRRICKSYGADITCGEMALCESLLKGTKQEWALVKRHESEDLFGVQICGYNVFLITKVAQLLQENTEIDFIDLNLGCPIDLIYKKGGGCGMMHRLPSLEASVRCASKILSMPFTAKVRTGVYEDKKIAHTVIPKLVEWGASLITLHGRSKEARYTKSANWEYVETCAKLASPCPVFGNGDVLSYEDYVQRRQLAPTAQGAMIGRGALIKPWIFTEIKEQKIWDISSNERFDILKKYTNYGLEHWGSDVQGVENTRRFLLEWLSFLYRYVPVGLLERPPQKINERPPCYFGRNDLETLMASGSCTDWIKISEMLLGPVPDGFQFLPKHKANSY